MADHDPIPFDDRSFRDREWTLLLFRMKSQDDKLDEILDKLDDVIGRVTALETDRAITADREQRRVRRSDVRRGKLEIVVAAMAVLLAGSVGAALLHLLGLA
jgi:hypothetical protein